MTFYQTLSLMLAFGTFTVLIITSVVNILRRKK